MNKLITLACATLASFSLASAEEVLLKTIEVKGPAKWWNENTQLNPLRLMPPQSGATVSYYDLNGDGKPDVLRTVTANGTPVQWVDDNANMKIGDLSGDLVDDCLMIDRNKDGKYGSYDDIIIDWTDTDGDGKADIQAVVEYKKESRKTKLGGHYMFVMDLDKDNIFNYLDYNTFELRCWLHDGLAEFYTDYIGNSLFLKNHNTPEAQSDVRLNWENPFIFIDSDKDGLTEMTVRLCDQGGDAKYGRNPNGKIDWAAICVDLDNDNTPENPLDLDMTIHFFSNTGTAYTKYSHIYKKLRGLPEADCYFLDPCWRKNVELIYPNEKECFDFIFKDATWDYTYFTYDEDGDCKRWERVELYRPGDLWKVGEKNGGLDQHRQSDAVGDRGEFDMDNSGKGALYISPMDGKIHLYGAEWGAWRIDQRAQHYQMIGGLYDIYGPKRQQTESSEFPTIKYEDTDGNGFFDRMLCDWNCDREFEEVLDLKALGLSDEAGIERIENMRVKDYNALYKKMAEAMWKQAQIAVKAAEKKGLDTSWYALYKTPKSLRQKYEYGYWLQLYIYHDFADLAQRSGDSALGTAAAKAFLSRNWKSLK